MSRVKKAYEKLETMAAFSETYEHFEALFWQSLDKSRKEEAIALLLEVLFELLKSDGVRYNALLEAVSAQQKHSLGAWLEGSLKKVGIG